MSSEPAPPPAAAVAVRLERASVAFRGPAGEEVRALDALELDVRRGEVLCLIGPSGCGKTTTLRLMNRMVEPSAGRVLVDGRDAAELDPVRLRRGMGYVIQSGGLFPHMTVRQNVGLLCELEGQAPERVRARADELLELVRLPPAEHAERFPAQLSGGQRQRVGVARALALDPPLVLLDEPFGALDPVTRAELQQEFLDLRRRVGKTMVLVTHDLEEAFALGDRVALLSEGRLVQVGTPDELRRAPRAGVAADFLERHLS